jgi:uncharacterized zinc-type alcohol dehydrogenase-like protein
MGGNQQLCPQQIPMILGHQGGFANKVRAHWEWVLPLPDTLDPASAGPLLCGGVTVFNPLLLANVKPTDRVGIVGIGGLGHMAVKFANAWGCEVTAFTSTPAKFEEAKNFGAHHAASSTDSVAIQKLAQSLDFLLVTANVPLDWSALINTLGARSRLHVVGAVLEPIPVAAFSLIMGDRCVSGSAIGSHNTIATMLAFAARHQISPQVEYFPMSKVNEALAHLASGKARYRIVLEANK